MSNATTKKAPLMSEPSPVSLINLDPAAAARSIAMTVAQANDEWDWVNEKVMIQFYNIEEPGCPGSFGYGPATSPKLFSLQHGEITELTRGEVRFIESRQTPMYAYKSDPNGKMRKQQIGWKPRFQCRQVNAKPSKGKV